jgi:hypothetical protein
MIWPIRTPFSFSTLERVLSNQVISPGIAGCGHQRDPPPEAGGVVWVL